MTKQTQNIPKRYWYFNPPFGVACSKSTLCLTYWAPSNAAGNPQPICQIQILNCFLIETDFQEQQELANRTEVVFFTVIGFNKLSDS